jgi:hypothetical protein
VIEPPLKKAYRGALRPVEQFGRLRIGNAFGLSLQAVPEV